MLLSDTQHSGRNCEPWEGQEWPLCLGEKQDLYMNSGMTKIQSEVTNPSVPTQKKSMHCTFVSCTQLVMQPQPPGPAQTQKLYSSFFSILFSPGAPLPFPHPHRPLFACFFVSPKKSLRETDLSFQHCADHLNPPLKL